MDVMQFRQPARGSNSVVPMCITQGVTAVVVRKKKLHNVPSNDQRTRRDAFHDMLCSDTDSPVGHENQTLDRDIIISMDLLRELSLEDNARSKNVVELEYGGDDKLPLRTSFSRKLECNVQKRARDRGSAGLGRSSSAPITPRSRDHLLPTLHLQTMERNLDKWIPLPPPSPPPSMASHTGGATLSILRAYRSGSGNLNTMKQKHW